MWRSGCRSASSGSLWPTGGTFRSSRRPEPARRGSRGSPLMSTTESDTRYDEAAKVGMTAAHWAEVQPDAPAIVSPLGDRTFAELNANANRLARVLRARGLGKGDAVAFMVTNRPQ